MNFLFRNKGLLTFLIALIAGLVFIPFIGNCPLFDWDEVNFAECAREMVISGDYSNVQLNYRPFWEKPPVFIWMQAISMNIFGINEFAARLPNAICSIATLVCLYNIGRRFHSPQFGLTWTFLYAATLLPHLYFKSGLIDPWFNLFILLAVYQCIRILNNPTGKRELLGAITGGIFLGMAVLTKGPAALAVVSLTLLVFTVWTRQVKLLVSKPVLLFAGSTLLVASSWFLIEWAKGNGHILYEFIDYQVRLFNTGDAGHGGPFFYHFVVLLIGCFPASLLFLASYLKFRKLTPYQRLFRKVMLCLFWVVLLLFSIVKTKIVHYSSLCYFPITFIAAIGLVQYFHELRFGKYLRALYWIVAILITVAFLAISLIDHYKHMLISNNLIADPFAELNLMAEVHWSGFELVLAPLALLASWLLYTGIKKQKIQTVYLGILINLSFIYLAIALIIPKVELYSQHAAIEFYRASAKQHCYVETHGFKSYAYLFYSNRKPNDYINPDQRAFIEKQLDVMVEQGHSRLTSFATANLLWMEYGVIDRPAYIVIKTPQENELLNNPDFRLLYRKNGFSFFVRMPASAK